MKMKKKKTECIIFALLALVFLSSGCGYLEDARVCKKYVKKVIEPCGEVGNLLLWPIHLVGLAGCAVIDQGARTFEIIPTAGRDSWDYFLMEGRGNNVMFERSVAIPKTVATPLIFVGSYLTRWLFPADNEDRPFKMDLPPRARAPYDARRSNTPRDSVSDY